VEDSLPVPGSVETNCHCDTITTESASIYLEMTIGFNRDECALHGRGVLQSMNENIRRLGKCNLNIAQKPEGVKFMELSSIDHRMMCPDLTELDLDKFDSWLRGEISSWLRLRGVPVGVPGLAW
jgi:hypothetical protein